MNRSLYWAASLGGALLAGNACSADGDLDLSFGIANGIGRSGVNDAYGTPSAAVVQSDGTIVTCDARGFLTQSDYDFFIARFRSDGTLDSSFGTSGTTTIDFDQTRDHCEGLAIQPDNKVVVAGWMSYLPPFGEGYSAFAVARLDASGVLDPTFGNGTGKTTVTFDAGASSAADVVLQPDGKIVVAGRAKVGEPGYAMDFALVRLLPDGALDFSFGTGGKATVGFYDIFSFDYATSVALDRQGRIVVIGAADSATGVARFLGDGQLDTSFGVDGSLILTSISSPGKVKLLHDGRIVIAGGAATGAGYGMAVLRLLEDGAPDHDFGTEGLSVVSFPLSIDEPESSFASDLAEQSDGKLVLAGSARYGDTNYTKAVAARVDAAGQLDISFGTQGKAVFDLGLSALDSQSFNAVASSGGRIIAVGSAIVDDTYENLRDDFVVRIQNDLVFAQGFE